MRFFAIAFALLAAVLGSPAAAQLTTGGVSKKEFPGLQLVPVGSVVQDISIPRYQDHKVSSLIKARELTVRTRSLVELSNATAEIYGKNGNSVIKLQKCRYDFTDGFLRSDKEAQLTDPRFSAKGQGLRFDSKRKIGLLCGPVTTHFILPTTQERKEEP